MQFDTPRHSANKYSLLDEYQQNSIEETKNPDETGENAFG